MAKYKVINSKPTVADFWWRQPLVNADGSLQKDTDGSIKVEQMVVRTVDSEKLDKVARYIDEGGAPVTKIEELAQKLKELEELIKNGGNTPVNPDKPTDEENMNYTIKSYTGASSYILPVNSYNVFAIVLTGATTSISLDVAGLSSTKLAEIRIYLKQGEGANTVKWSSNIKWLNGIDPVLSFGANKTDIVQLSSIDGGTTWFGSVVSSWN